MPLISKTELDMKKDIFLRDIKSGIVFVYPTDTIYGIGCDATNSESVKKVRKIKERHDMPFSVIAPSKDWIRDNCVIDDQTEEWLDKLPGPYTLILKIKNKDCIANEVTNGLDTLGVRIPDHWFTNEVVSVINKPIVTTSVNKHGEEYMVSIDNLDHSIWPEYIFYEGKKEGSPSKIVDLTGKEPVVKR